MRKSRDIIFSIEEIVEIYAPRSSYRKDGMIDAVQLTKGYAIMNQDDEVEHLQIDECRIISESKPLVISNKEKDISMLKSLIRKVFKSQ